MQCMKFIYICFYTVITKKKLWHSCNPGHHSQVYHYPEYVKETEPPLDMILPPLLLSQCFLLHLRNTLSYQIAPLRFSLIYHTFLYTFMISLFIKVPVARQNDPFVLPPL